jgi:DNA-binding response OmpR family regulator
VKILLVEDSVDIATLMEAGLREDGHEVLRATDGLAGMEAVWRFKPDLLLLDIGLPVVDGLTVLRRIRESGNSLPVIMVTGRTEDSDVVEGLGAGADDYICKPFSIAELRARITALSRRMNRESTALELRYEDLIINLRTRKVTRAGRDLELTSREFAVVHLLMESPQKPISRDELGLRLWGRAPSSEDRTVEVLVSRLRKKLDLPGLPALIVTSRNAGYSIGLPALPTDGG